MRWLRKIRFSRHQRRLLKALTIDERMPGPMLHDFGAFLSFLREQDVRATGALQLPLRTLPEINARLARPLHLDLKRPVQKSYPHINGLYLLLRASGLVRIGGSAKKPLIVVDEEIRQRWQTLNPTERYLTLFETWLLRAPTEIINERETGGHFLPHTFERWGLFFLELPDQGLTVGDDEEAARSLRYWPGLHHLALMELFGLVAIQHGTPEPGKGWRIERVEPTPLGEAMLALLVSEFFSDHNKVQELKTAGRVPFGVLQPLLQPYFPTWGNNLSIPDWTFRPGTHIFKVAIAWLWRRIAIPGGQPLDALARAIVDSVDFTHDHLYDFRYQNRFGVVETIRHPFLGERPRTDEVLVGEVPLPVGQTMRFTYDFGDWWEFDLLLEAVDPDVSIDEATLLESHGVSPEQYRWHGV